MSGIMLGKRRQVGSSGNKANPKGDLEMHNSAEEEL